MSIDQFGGALQQQETALNKQVAKVQKAGAAGDATQAQVAQQVEQMRAQYWSENDRAVRVDPTTGQAQIYRAQYDMKSGTLNLSRTNNIPGGLTTGSTIAEHADGSIDLGTSQRLASGSKGAYQQINDIQRYDAQGQYAGETQTQVTARRRDDLKHGDSDETYKGLTTERHSITTDAQGATTAETQMTTDAFDDGTKRQSLEQAKVDSMDANGNPVLYRERNSSRSLDADGNVTSSDDESLTHYDRYDEYGRQLSGYTEGYNNSTSVSDGDTTTTQKGTQATELYHYDGTGALRSLSTDGSSTGHTTSSNSDTSDITLNDTLSGMTKFDAQGNTLSDHQNTRQVSTQDGKDTVQTSDTLVSNNGRPALDAKGRPLEGATNVQKQSIVDPTGGMDDDHEGTTDISVTATADGKGGWKYGDEDMSVHEEGGDDDYHDAKYHIALDPETGEATGDPDKYYEHTEQEWYEDLRDDVAKFAPIASVGAIAIGALAAPFTGGTSLAAGLGASALISGAGAAAEGSKLIQGRKDASWTSFGLDAAGVAGGIGSVGKLGQFGGAALKGFSGAAEGVDAAGISGARAGVLGLDWASKGGAAAAIGKDAASGAYAAENGGVLTSRLGSLAETGKFPIFKEGGMVAQKAPGIARAARIGNGVAKGGLGATADRLAYYGKLGVSGVRDTVGGKAGFGQEALAGKVAKAGAHINGMGGQMAAPFIAMKTGDTGYLQRSMDQPGWMQFAQGNGRWIAAGGLASVGGLATMYATQPVVAPVFEPAIAGALGQGGESAQG